MAGRIPHLDSNLPDLEPIALFHKTLRLRQNIRGERGRDDLRAIARHKRRHTLDMVVVPMRDEDEIEAPAALLKLGNHRFAGRRIHERDGAGRLITDENGVIIRKTGEKRDLHRYSFSRWGMHHPRAATPLVQRKNQACNPTLLISGLSMRARSAVSRKG